MSEQQRRNAVQILLTLDKKDYEEGMPSGTMDKIVNQFTPDGIGKLLSDNDVKVLSLIHI